MGSSAEPERSISSGISIPQWMKTRIGDRYDIEEPFSPPIHDDTFFYIRYPKSKSKPTVTEPAITLIEEEKPRLPIQDFSQHTLPCRQFIPEAKMSIDMKELPSSKPQPPKMKSQGTDDGFSGDGAACGKSVVQVAQQMISGKFVTRGFSNPNNNDNLAIPTDFDARRRRGSKSLPASPLVTPSQSPESSPRLRRKQVFTNRFFTGNFNALDKSGSQESTARYPGSWILSSFLGQRETSNVTQMIHEESHVQESTIKEGVVQQKEEVISKVVEKKELDIRRNMSTPSLAAADSVEDISEAKPILKIKSPPTREPNKGFVPKPSELREMNFWSPTSM